MVGAFLPGHTSGNRAGFRERGFPGPNVGYAGEGGVAERTKVAVLKTAGGQPPVGSNPTPSATRTPDARRLQQLGDKRGARLRRRPVPCRPRSLGEVHL